MKFSVHVSLWKHQSPVMVVIVVIFVIDRLQFHLIVFSSLFFNHMKSIL